jgi:hypothetical protein
MQALAAQEAMSSQQRESVYKFLTKWIVPAAAVVGLFAALFGGTKYVIKAEVSDMSSDIATLKDNVKHLTDGSTDTNRRIDDLLAKALDRAFPKPSPTATKSELKEDFKRANDLLRFAASENIHLNPQLITMILDYRSLLNERPVSFPAQLERYKPGGPSKWVSIFRWHGEGINVQQKAEGDVFYSIHWVPASNAARLETMEAADINETYPRGPDTILIKGGGVRLDGLRVKNVVFENVDIYYRGGPLMIEKATFVSCRFFLSVPQPNVELFGAELLQSSPVTFTAG